MRVRLRICTAIGFLAGLMLLTPLRAEEGVSLNKPERLEEFRDLGVGMFIHWSFDSQLGMVISHSMVGASEDYVSRLVTELPRTFDPKRYDPEEWARLARVCGIKYAVFTTKHHSGFCMFHTLTTDFGIAHTFYGVRPWHVTHEDNIWFTKAKNADTLYAIVTGDPDWERGTRKQFIIRSARATGQSEVSVLGQNSEVLEYRPDVNPECRWSQEADGLHVDVMRTQRIYNMGDWPNPVVLKITHVTQGSSPGVEAP